MLLCCFAISKLFSFNLVLTRFRTISDSVEVSTCFGPFVNVFVVAGCQDSAVSVGVGVVAIQVKSFLVGVGGDGVGGGWTRAGGRRCLIAYIILLFPFPPKA